MTTPTIFSTRTTVSQGQYNFRHGGKGAVLADQTVITIPASTASGTNCAAFFIKAGFRLLGMTIKTDDLDTGTNVTLKSGILYATPSASAVEDDDLYMTSSTIAQSGGEYIWHNTSDPAVSNPQVVAAADGWLTITTGGGSTTTGGNIYVSIWFDYGVPTT